MEFTGEMMIPEKNRGTIIFGEHWARYIFAAQFVKRKVVLDVACGSGYGTNYLAEKGAKQVYGVDISKEAVDYAKKEYNHPKVKFIVGDAQDISLPDHSVDVVVSMETIEHVENSRKFLDEVKRVLAKDGLFILSTPSARGYREDYTPSRWHFKEFAIDELSKLLKKYFNQVKFFYQHDWISSAVLGRRSALKDSILQEDKFRIVKISAREPINCAYVIGLCSDADLPAKVVEVSTLYSIREMGDMLGRMKRLEKQIVELESELKGIHISKSWRIAMFLRTIALWVLKPFRALRQK